MNQRINKLAQARKQLDAETKEITKNRNEDSWDDTVEVQARVCELYDIDERDLSAEGRRQMLIGKADFLMDVENGETAAISIGACVATAWEMGLLTGIILERERNKDNE